MKRLIVSTLIFAALAIGVSACGSSEKCPAYSTVEQPTDIDA